jgi:hypothetical protein
VVDVTEVRPVSVVAVAPSETLVEPMVTDEFVRPAFGMPVKFVPVSVGVFVHEGVVPETRTCDEVPVVSFAVTPAPDWYKMLPAAPAAMLVAVEALPVSAPTKVVAVSEPVDGTNESFVEETFDGLLPDVAPTQVGYTVVAVATSSVIVVFVAFVAVVAEVADVAVDALPDRVAVMVPALKLPEASRSTSVDAVFVDTPFVATVMEPAPFVMTTPVPCVSVAS